MSFDLDSILDAITDIFEGSPWILAICIIAFILICAATTFICMLICNECCNIIRYCCSTKPNRSTTQQPVKSMTAKPKGEDEIHPLVRIHAPQNSMSKMDAKKCVYLLLCVSSENGTTYLKYNHTTNLAISNITCIGCFDMHW